MYVDPPYLPAWLYRARAKRVWRASFVELRKIRCLHHITQQLLALVGVYLHKFSVCACSSVLSGRQRMKKGCSGVIYSRVFRENEESVGGRGTHLDAWMGISREELICGENKEYGQIEITGKRKKCKKKKKIEKRRREKYK